VIKVVVLLRKKRRTTPESFRRWWLEHHSAIVRRLPGLRQYVISFAISGSDSRWDGMAELWFDNEDAADQAYSSPLGKEVVNDSSNNTSSIERMRVTEVQILSSVEGPRAVAADKE
jgi:uncharacterized protein (TIGR02118 family)